MDTKDDSWAGIFPNMPMSEYHAKDLGVVSAGALKTLNRKSPAHYRYAIETGNEKKRKTFDFGRAAHAYILEPQTFAGLYYIAPFGAPKRPDSRQRNAVNPSAKTIEAIEFWDAFDAANSGKLPLSAEDYQKIQDMRAALDNVEMVGDLPSLIIAEGQAEVSMRWVDEETGLRCRSRPDWWLPRLSYFMDYKTCEDASERGFAAAVTRYDYHVAHCHYADGARVLGVPIRNYLFLCQEKEPPYAAAIYTIDAAAEERGFELRKRGMAKMAACVASGRWPGYSHEITQLRLPGYAFYD